LLFVDHKLSSRYGLCNRHREGSNETYLEISLKGFNSLIEGIIGQQARQSWRRWDDVV